MSGKIIIITAPSGAGKTSITRYLLNKYSKLAFSISAATRQARGKEKNGIDYYFMSLEEFQQKIKNNDFLEWEMVYEASGVKEYWVVDPETKWCEGFVLENGAYKSLGEGNGKLTIQMFNLPVSF